MLTVNKRVACAPFETTQTKVDVKGGLPVIRQKHELTALDVVLDTDDGEYFQGDRVWVRGEMCKTAGREVFEVDGVSFVLIPYDAVLLRDDEDDEE